MQASGSKQPGEVPVRHAARQRLAKLETDRPPLQAHVLRECLEDRAAAKRAAAQAATEKGEVQAWKIQ